MRTPSFLKVRQRAVAVVAAITLVACGGGGGGDAEPAPTVQTTRAPVTVVATSDRSYGAVAVSKEVKVEVFRTITGEIGQALYTNTVTGERLRLYNGSDGLPQRAVDEVNGTALVIERVAPDRIDYRSYDRDGKYLGGYAVLTRGGVLQAAPILGTPSISGQLVGQLSGVGQSGSFALLPDANAGLGAPVAFSKAALDLADAANLPAGPTVGKQKFAGIDGRAVIGGLVMGAAIGVAGTAVVPALVAGAMTAWFLQNYGLPIFDGVRNADSLEQMSDNLNTFLGGLRSDAPAGDAMSASLAGTLADRITGSISRSFDAARDTAAALGDRSVLPTLSARAPAVDASVAGAGVDQSGVNYSYSGTAQAAGVVTLTGAPLGGGLPITINGNITGMSLTGTMSGRLGNGTVSGSLQQLGQCAALQQSGGQGTFSYAFDAGATTGQIAFYREAYNIPDGFRVISGSNTLYDTGGLVSGSETVTLALNGSRTLFVTVNAPTSGTAWQLSVGCPT